MEITYLSFCALGTSANIVYENGDASPAKSILSERNSNKPLCFSRVKLLPERYSKPLTPVSPVPLRFKSRPSWSAVLLVLLDAP